MKAKRIWALVADGARARIVRGVDVAGEEQLDDLVYEADHKPLREIMSDRPGRSFSSVGTRRSAMEYHSDPEREGEAQFASTLLAELGRRHAAGEFDALAIVAEPRMLGLIRKNLPESLRDVIAAEIPKDLTKLPPVELRRALLNIGI